MIFLLFGVFTPCFTPNTFVLDVFFFLKQVTYNHVESIVRFNFNANTVQSVSGCGYNLDLITDNVMSFFWVDPSGRLWYPDYSGTQDIYFVRDRSPLGVMDCKPNGNRGRLTRVYITDYVNIYDSKTYPDGYFEMVECKLHFIDGTLQDYKYINRHIMS